MLLGMTNWYLITNLCVCSSLRKVSSISPLTAPLISLYSLFKVETLWGFVFLWQHVYYWLCPGPVQAAELDRLHGCGFWHLWFIVSLRKHDLKLKNTSQTHMPTVYAWKLAYMYICVWISRYIAHLRIVIAILK